MSTKGKKSGPRHCPYNANEIKRASACLKQDAERGPIAFMQRRLSFISASSFSNVWEGNEGYMEHVKGSFPMPEKVSEEDQSEVGDSDLKDLGHGISSSSKCPVPAKKTVKKKSKVGSNISGPSSSMSSASPIDSNSVGLTNNVSRSHTVFDSEEEDCVIVENEEKEVIEIREDDDCVGGKDVSASNNEVIHWQRLFKLHDKITEAKQSLKKIDIMFQYGQFLVKACEDISLLRTHIISLINQLRQAKDDIVNNNFSETLSSKMKKEHFQQQVFKENNTSYTDIWSLFKSLCNNYVSVRAKWKNILLEHRQFQNSSPTELQTSIQSIKFTIKT